jgi:RNA polymerase sigma factor (sigma-70 family)
MQAASNIGERPSAAAELLRALIDSRAELVHFLTRRLICRANAEDIAQEVFIRLTASKAVAVHPRRLIFSTAANLAFNQNRDERRRAAIRNTLIAPVEDAVDEQSPERIVLARDSLRKLAQELSTWPERTREIFILNRFDGLTQREIALKFGVSKTIIERHMVRAIVRLGCWGKKMQ